MTLKELFKELYPGMGKFKMIKNSNCAYFCLEGVKNSPYAWLLMDNTIRMYGCEGEKVAEIYRCNGEVIIDMGA